MIFIIKIILFLTLLFEIDCNFMFNISRIDDIFILRKISCLQRIYALSYCIIRRINYIYNIFILLNIDLKILILINTYFCSLISVFDISSRNTEIYLKMQRIGNNEIYRKIAC